MSIIRHLIAALLVGAVATIFYLLGQQDQDVRCPIPAQRAAPANR